MYTSDDRCRGQTGLMIIDRSFGSDKNYSLVASERLI